MEYVNNKKTYNMIPYSCIPKILQLVGAADNIMDVLQKIMTKWKVQLNVGDEISGDVNTKRGISQGDCLSPFLFVNCLILMSLIQKKMKARHSLGKSQSKLDHLLHVDDLTMFGQSETPNHL